VSASRSTSGSSDLGFGLKYQLVSEGETWPDLVASLDVVAPTGNAETLDPLEIFPIRFGGGRWRLGGGLNFVRSYDPAVLFGGISYTHSFPADLASVPVSGGDIFSYSFGLGFALNDRITLSGQFGGIYVTQVTRAGETIITNREAFTLRTALTYRFSSGQYIEPSISYALNRDSSDVVVALSYVHRF
jgi:hypothetical protein